MKIKITYRKKRKEEMGENGNNKIRRQGKRKRKEKAL